MVCHATGTTTQGYPSWGTVPSGFTQLPNTPVHSTTPSGSKGDDDLLVAWANLPSGATGSFVETSSTQLSIAGGLVAIKSAATGGGLQITGSGIASAEAFGASTVVADTPVRAWFRTRAGTQYTAFAGGSQATYGEETLENYHASAAYNADVALEISLWQTSDGVWVCSQDSTTGRVFSGTSQTIGSVTWATISSKTTLVGGHLIRRLEDIIGDSLLAGRFFLIDNKTNANHSALISVLETYCSGHWMAKAPVANSSWLNAASAVACPVACYLTPSDVANLSTIDASLTTARAAGSPIVFSLGDYSGTAPTQANATTLFTYTSAHGISEWARVLATTTQKTTADGQASTAGGTFDGYELSAVSAILPGPQAITGTGIASAGAFGSAATVTISAAHAALTVTPDTVNSPPRMTLTVSGLGVTDSSTQVTIQRIDPAGNVSPVRLANPGVLISGSWVGFDYEAPFGQPVTYVATTEKGDSVTSASATLPVTDAWLIHPGVPSWSVQITVANIGTRTRVVNRGLHKVLGRRTPIAITDGVRGAPSFELQVRADDAVTGDALDTILGTSSALLLQIPQTTGAAQYAWVSVSDAAEDSIIPFLEDQHAVWTLPCDVVDAPSGLLQSQWTWADVLATYADWSQVLAHYETWQDVVLNNST
jgi:hypothetical protein